MCSAVFREISGIPDFRNLEQPVAASEYSNKNDQNGNMHKKIVKFSSNGRLTFLGDINIITSSETGFANCMENQQTQLAKDSVRIGRPFSYPTSGGKRKVLGVYGLTISSNRKIRRKTK